MKVFSYLPILFLSFRVRLTDASLRSATTTTPLKVFLLVGQSNMQGHGYIDKTDDKGNYRNGTLEWMVQTFPKQYGKLKKRHNHWRSRKDVWIAYNRQRVGNVRVKVNQHGPLIPGYGGDPGQEGKHMGPELGFGWTLGNALEEPILLIKVAWGGRSLAVDYRPPSSGGTTGLYYEAMMADVFKALGNLEQLFPDYASIGRYELAGFVWHQGWNDGCNQTMTDEYETNLANLIKDIRTDLGVPDLPVSIGVSGMSGYNPRDPKRDAIVAAQFAVANATKYPEFAGTVASVETRDFWRGPVPASPGNQGYHWNNNCETYWLVGQAMGKAMIKLLKDKNESRPWSTPAATSVA